MKLWFKRALEMLAVCLLALAGIATTSPTALAYTQTCGSYGSTPSFACVAFSGFHGQSPWGYPTDANGHNCTNYVSYRLWQNGAPNPGNLGNAKDWDNNAAAYGIPVNNTPAVGTIAVWEAYSPPAYEFGHVAYVDAVGSNYIDISEDNYGGTSMTKRLYVGESWYPDHFIHFKDVLVTPPPAVIGNQFYMNNGFDGTHDFVTNYGDPGDAIIAGDWDGNGTDTLGIRRGGTYYLNNNFDGTHDFVTNYGDPSDQVFVGDWDGDGDDTLAIRRGNQFYLNNNFDGSHDILTNYGDPGDVAIVGDWDGDGDDTLGVKRGATYYLNNNFDGSHDILTSYGEAADKTLDGNWDGIGGDTLGIRR